jgi:hypothetical protein
LNSKLLGGPPKVLRRHWQLYKTSGHCRIVLMPGASEEMVWFKLNGYPLKSQPTSKIGNSFTNCHKANYMKHFIFGEKYSGRGHMILHGNLVELNFMSVKFAYWYNSNRIVEYKSWFSTTHEQLAH